jgi:uncharacterized damage-inducible protein DinB
VTTAQEIANTFAANLWIIKKQTDDLTHEDSLLQPPFRGNCLNWVLGHIVVGRNRALALLQQEQVWGETERERYETGSDPVVSGEEGVWTLEQLLGALDLAQERIVAGLEHKTPEELAKVVPFRGRDSAIADAIRGLAWHETYHTGQTELLRQLAGKNDRVIG